VNDGRNNHTKLFTLWKAVILAGERRKVQSSSGHWL